MQEITEQRHIRNAEADKVIGLSQGHYKGSCVNALKVVYVGARTRALGVCVCA